MCPSHRFYETFLVHMLRTTGFVCCHGFGLYFEKEMEKMQEMCVLCDIDYQ